MDLCCGEGKYICCCAVYGVGTQLSLGLREQRGLEGEGWVCESERERERERESVCVCVCD